MTALFVLLFIAAIIGVIGFVGVKLISVVLEHAKPAVMAADHHSLHDSIDDAPLVKHSSMVNYSMCDSLFLDSKSYND